jgi:pyruvate formate lyase activating enzyme
MPENRAPTPTPLELREAMHYHRLGDHQVQCDICFRQCVVSEGKLGFCSNKKNIGGNYYSLIHDQPCALQIDPIEKEPVFHVLPGTSIFCVGTASCNSRCRFCHNWHMSQQSLWETNNYQITPGEVVERAKASNCGGISFTYNEPTVFYEYMYDIACSARAQGLHTICHTNGTMLGAALSQLLERLDAVTVDLKGFSEEFYHKVCSLELAPVLSTLKRIGESDVHLEIVNLVISELNDAPEGIRRMCNWISGNLGTEVPLHFTRFHPSYKLQRLPATPVETLEAAVSMAEGAGLRYVYVGNVPGHQRNSTFCPECGKRIIHRMHFFVWRQFMVDGKCSFCGHPIPGIWAA